jgi:hypothetical protein
LFVEGLIHKTEAKGVKLNVTSEKDKCFGPIVALFWWCFG